jgi:hypothetical protein
MSLTLHQGFLAQDLPGTLREDRLRGRTVITLAQDLDVGTVISLNMGGELVQVTAVRGFAGTIAKRWQAGTPVEVVSAPTYRLRHQCRYCRAELTATGPCYNCGAPE